MKRKTDEFSSLEKIVALQRAFRGKKYNPDGTWTKEWEEYREAVLKPAMRPTKEEIDDIRRSVERRKKYDWVDHNIVRLLEYVDILEAKIEELKSTMVEAS